MNGSCCNLWREEIKGISGWRVVCLYFIFQIVYFVFLSVTSKFRDSLGAQLSAASVWLRGGGQKAEEEVYMEPKL